GGAGLRAPRGPRVVAGAAGEVFQRGLSALEAEPEAADRAGDADRARAAADERGRLLDELRRATGLAGRPRSVTAEAEKARVNVTRTIRATIDRIAHAAPRASAHLAASVRTGRTCRYDPAPDGPARWRV